MLHRIMAAAQHETLSAAVTITAPGEIGVYVKAFGELTDQAI
jgi:hypothetical protein